MFARWKNWRRRRLLDRYRIDAGLWQATAPQIPAAAHLDATACARLHDTASLFLAEKSIEGAGGMRVTDAMGARIAAECCIPILNLSLDLFDGWHSVVVYPDEFIARHDYTDENGVHHSVRDMRTGEAWERGPVILSWQDIAQPEPGQSVAIHEMAHKLDLLDGVSNGFPPLHRDMDPRDWSGAFSAAYAELEQQVSRDHWTEIDPYGAESPAEFFAVVCEEFFTRPMLLRRQYPGVYNQLALYFRQDPGRTGALS